MADPGSDLRGGWGMDFVNGGGGWGLKEKVLKVEKGVEG